MAQQSVEDSETTRANLSNVCTNRASLYQKSGGLSQLDSQQA
jgi:hypothetical protein